MIIGALCFLVPFMSWAEEAKEHLFVAVLPVSGPNLQPEIFPITAHPMRSKERLRDSEVEINEIWKLLEEVGVRVFLSPELSRKLWASAYHGDRSTNPTERILARKVKYKQNDLEDGVGPLSLLKVYLRGMKELSGLELHYEPLCAGNLSFRRENTVIDQIASLIIAEGGARETAKMATALAPLYLSGNDKYKVTGDLVADWRLVMKTVGQTEVKVLSHDPELNLLLLSGTSVGVKSLARDFAE